MKRKVVTIIGVVLILLLFIKTWEYLTKTYDIERGTVQYDKENKLEESTEPYGNIIFPAYENDIQFDKNENVLPIKLINPEVNDKAFLKYIITIISDSVEIKILETNLIESGTVFEYPEIDKNLIENLSRGDYECRIDVYAYQKDNPSDTSFRKLNQVYWTIQFNIL